MMLQVMAVFATSSRQHKVFLNHNRISQQLMGIYRKLTTNDVEMTADNFKVRETLLQTTILDKTVEKIACLGAFFLDFVADRFFPPPLPLEAVLLGLQKKAGSLSICRKQLWTGGGGFLYPKPFIWK